MREDGIWFGDHWMNEIANSLSFWRSWTNQKDPSSILVFVLYFIGMMGLFWRELTW